jgi:hypothetical protein
VSIIVRVTCDPTEWLSPTEATLDYGEVSNDLVGLEEFLSEEDREIVTWHIYTLSSDQSHIHDATHVVAIQLGTDERVGKVIWLDGIIDGPFLLMLMKGSKLKGFHCESCAENFGHWLVDKQVLWKERYHATRSPKDKKETNYTH